MLKQNLTRVRPAAVVSLRRWRPTVDLLWLTGEELSVTSYSCELKHTSQDQSMHVTTRLPRTSISAEWFSCSSTRCLLVKVWCRWYWFFKTGDLHLSLLKTNNTQTSPHCVILNHCADLSHHLHTQKVHNVVSGPNYKHYVVILTYNYPSSLNKPDEMHKINLD